MPTRTYTIITGFNLFTTIDLYGMFQIMALTISF